jgi:hypothetical protein
MAQFIPCEPDKGKKLGLLLNENWIPKRWKLLLTKLLLFVCNLTSISSQKVSRESFLKAFFTFRSNSLSNLAKLCKHWQTNLVFRFLFFESIISLDGFFFSSLWRIHTFEDRFSWIGWQTLTTYPTHGTTERTTFVKRQKLRNEE